MLTLLSTMTAYPSILLRATTRRSIYPVHAFRCQRTFATSKTLSKTAIVSGSGQGIGKAIALRLARDGFDVCVNDLENNSSSVESVVNEIKSLGRNAVPVYADVSKYSYVESMVETSVNALGPLDVIVANAGITKVHLVLDATEADTQRILAVNFCGVLWQDQAAAKQFIKQGTGGKIINCASIVAFRPLPLVPIYSASKAAVRSLTQSFAMELAKHKITVNAYAPGIVDTPMWRSADEIMSSINGLPKGQNFENTKSMIALGETSVPEDVAKMVSYLASPDSDYVTGQTMIVDGGMVFS
ncbi:hypothetical protein D9757_010180 [Collybiopsis confluens]|uniref:diacetyl reductase [(S)-acetoin forming] n=1 Tax=Collybiopsis confluens TaxID=2823264 RepID=A0A8H5LYU8_9AGAR|nr:hypothetical protein D9757_010180 [Collybiopsis confluens]